MSLRETGLQEIRTWHELTQETSVHYWHVSELLSIIDRMEEEKKDLLLKIGTIPFPSVNEAPKHNARVLVNHGGSEFECDWRTQVLQNPLVGYVCGACDTRYIEPIIGFHCACGAVVCKVENPSKPAEPTQRASSDQASAIEVYVKFGTTSYLCEWSGPYLGWLCGHCRTSIVRPVVAESCELCGAQVCKVERKSEPKSETFICRNCQSKNDVAKEGASFCRNCGLVRMERRDSVPVRTVKVKLSNCYYECFYVPTKGWLCGACHDGELGFKPSLNDHCQRCGASVSLIHNPDDTLTNTSWYCSSCGSTNIVGTVCFKCKLPKTVPITHPDGRTERVPVGTVEQKPEQTVGTFTCNWCGTENNLLKEKASYCKQCGLSMMSRKGPVPNGSQWVQSPPLERESEDQRAFAEFAEFYKKRMETLNPILPGTQPCAYCHKVPQAHNVRIHADHVCHLNAVPNQNFCSCCGCQIKQQTVRAT